MDDPGESPLSESTYFILLSLSRRPRHGYAIMKDVRKLSENRVVLSTGTLYGALKRLLDHGWIIRTDDPDPTDDARDRKVYRLSKHGQRALNREIARLRELLLVADQQVAEERT